MLTVMAGLAGGAFWHLQNSIIVDNAGTGAASLQEEVDPSMLEGEGDGRINALLIGTDVDESGNPGLADVIILASFDPVADDVVLLSIPRDMYVDMAEFGSTKINAAHVYGEERDYPGGGPGLLKDTVSQTLDVPVHYYARVNFEGFERAIDNVGGITVDVEEPINDPYFPEEHGSGYAPFSINAGEQTMDGETALQYVRSRKTTSDFDRNRRQQKVLMALRDKAASRSTLINPARISSLLNTLGDSAQTDISIEEMVRLAEMGEDVGREDVTREQLSTTEGGLLSFSSMYGQSVLVPSSGKLEDIQEHVRSLLVDGYIREEGARVSVLNGTWQTGAAEEAANTLRSYGYNVVNVDNAQTQDYEESVIFSYSDTPYTLRYLENRFDTQARHSDGDSSGYDIEIVLGNDYVSAVE